MVCSCGNRKGAENEKRIILFLLSVFRLFSSGFPDGFFTEAIPSFRLPI